MKKIIILAGLLLGISLNAQTNTNSIPIEQPITQVFDFLRTGSNFIVVPYGIYDLTSKEAGGGVGLAYKVSDFVLPTLRLDYIDGDIFMPSGSVQLQLPIKFSTNVWLTPFVFGGVATALSGNEGTTSTAIGIFGLGGDLRLNNHWGVLADYERWADHQQVRAGFHYKF